MKKQPIKVIKREDGISKPPSVAKEDTKKKKKKKRSIESTIQDWIVERRENETTEVESSNVQIAAWNDEAASVENA